MEVVFTILNETERDLLLAKKGFKYKPVHVLCKKCNSLLLSCPKKLLLPENWFCRKCKISITKQKKTKEEKDKIQEKRKQTTLARYGVDNVFKAQCIKDKTKNTLKELYDITNAQQLQTRKGYIKKAEKSKTAIKELKQIDLEQHQQFIEQSIKTKWDTRTQEDRARILAKRIETNRKKYGTDFAQQSKSVQNKYKENSLRKYGTDHPQQSFTVRQKVEATFRKKYGSNHPNACFEYENLTFDSSWELAVWIWAIDNKKSIKREPCKIVYEYGSKQHIYYPDFEIEGQLIELKGPQFFDQNGKMINPFNRAGDNLMEAKHQAALANGVKFWQYEDLKDIFKYIKTTYTWDYIELFRKNIPFPYPKLRSNSDQDIIRYFHKSVFHAHRLQAKSPYEAWQDKRLVKLSALNRLKYVKNCSPEAVVAGFTVAKIAPKVSVFKVALAERLIKTYLQSFTVIFDPFSGFSGRMLGAVKCNKRYVGQDINSDHVRESNEIINYKDLSSSCQVSLQNILLDSKKDYECLFTCPPYGGKEHWNIKNDEIEKSCDEWIDICLGKYKCKAYLFVVDKTEKYKNYVVETITNRSHFGKNNEYVLLVTRPN